MRAEPKTAYHGSTNPYATYVDLSAPQQPSPPGHARVPVAPPPPPIAHFAPRAPARRSGRGLRALAAVVLVLGAAGTGAAYAGNAYARSKVCAELAQVGSAEAASTGPGDTRPGNTGAGNTGPGNTGAGNSGAGNNGQAVGSAGAAPDAAALRRDVATMRRYARLLVFDGDLRAATHGLADDVAGLVELTEAHPGVAPADLDGAARQRLMLLAGRFDGHVRAGQQACDLPVTGAGG
jgi:hypothetical protein